MLAQDRGDFGLAAGYQHHEFCLLGEREADCVVGRRVAGVQGGDDVNAFRQLRRKNRGFDRQVVKIHARETEALRQGSRLVDEFRARFDADDAAGFAGLEKQVVEDEAEIGFSRAMIDEREVGAVSNEFIEQWFDEVVKVVNLLELAAAVLVELALAGQDVQFLEQFDGLPRTEFVDDVGRGFLHRPIILGEESPD